MGEITTETKTELKPKKKYKHIAVDEDAFISFKKIKNFQETDTNALKRLLESLSSCRYALPPIEEEGEK